MPKSLFGLKLYNEDTGEERIIRGQKRLRENQNRPYPSDIQRIKKRERDLPHLAKKNGKVSYGFSYNPGCCRLGRRNYE